MLGLNCVWGAFTAPNLRAPSIAAVYRVRIDFLMQPKTSFLPAIADNVCRAVAWYGHPQSNHVSPTVSSFLLNNID